MTLLQTDAETIRVLQPRLPEASLLMPFLRRIDQSRIYSNFGPLAIEFESRLASVFGIAPENVTTASSGTLALTMALMAQTPPPGALCAMPSWTFAATAHAVLASGLRPYLIDVEPETWAIEPDRVLEAIRTAPEKVGAVVPVVPFGRPFDYAAWDRLAAETGLAVAIDAAAAFDTVTPGEAPVMVSLHATKGLGVGEGGLVLSKDAALVRRVRQISCFGFFPGQRMAAFAGLNAKLSEYAAAVGLAALDGWPYLRVGLASLARSYNARLGALPGVSPMPGLDGSYAVSTYVVELDPGLPSAEHVAALLKGAGIETRRWWGDGCHAQPAFADCARTPLDVTEDLARRALGLPFHLGVGPGEMSRIVGALADAIVEPALMPPLGLAV